MRAPRLAAVVEVEPDDHHQVPRDLVAAAYRASHAGTVLLVLNGLSSAQIDRALDSVVGHERGVAGVEYCIPGTLGDVLQRRGWPFVGAVRTTALARQLSGRQVVLVPPDKALGILGDLHAWGRLSARVPRANKGALA
jgi:hypothetical protein